MIIKTLIQRSVFNNFKTHNFINNRSKYTIGRECKCKDCNFSLGFYYRTDIKPIRISSLINDAFSWKLSEMHLSYKTCNQITMQKACL